MQVAAPAETRPDSVTERRSAAHAGDPKQHGPHPSARPDLRVRVEHERPPQRVRARQAEPRTMNFCHARKPRRDPSEG